MASKFLIFTLMLSTTLLLYSASAQITTPCTTSMIATFTPCMNFITNSSSNGMSPTTDCCNSLRSLMSNGKDCLCLIATGGVPFQIPNINRNLAISLPRACNMPGVPLQCKAAAGAPVPAPGPLANEPTLSPFSAPSPRAPAPPEPLAPTEGGPTQTPPAVSTNSEAPTSNTGSRDGVAASAAHPSYTVSPLFLMAVLGAIAFKYYSFF